MATQAFYRKWRSQTFSELVGQEHVTRTLRNAVRTGRVAHAYVFSGPRGVGKTSAARLLAKAVNCESPIDGEPCNDCSACRVIAEGRAIDVIEIDAASNRKIDDIRDLREKVNFAPSELRYKFYILDEAHQLTGDAADAFLKTLEEPPAHTVFILATTEIHDISATILSRCQHLEFRRIGLSAMLTRLRQICAGESIEAEEKALELIARAATGSLRDAEGLLDQVVAYSGGRVAVEEVRSIVGLGGYEASHQLLTLLAMGDLAGGLRLINQLVESGTDARHFGREVVDYLRGLMLLKVGEKLSDLLDVTEETLAQMMELAPRFSVPQVLQCIRIFSANETSTRGVSLGQLPLEMALVEASLVLSGEASAMPAASSEAIVQPAPQPARLPRLTPEPLPRPPSLATRDRPEPERGLAQPAQPTRSVEPPLVESPPVPAVVAPAATRRRAPDASAGRAGPGLAHSEVVAKWPEIVERSGSINKSIQALLRDVRPVDVNGTTVILGCRFPFHRDRLNEDKTRIAVEGVIDQVLGAGRRCRAQFVVDNGEAPREVAPPPDPFQAVIDDPVVKGAIGMGWRVRRVANQEEVIYDAESQDDTAVPGTAGQDSGGPR